MVVDDLHRGAKVGHAHTRQHRTKDFFLVNLHVGGHVVKQGATHPEAIFTTGTGLRAVKLAAVHQQLCAFGHARIDVALDALACGIGHDGAHLGGQVFAIEHLQGFGALDQLGQDFVGHIAHQHGHADRHAALARRAVACTNQRVHGLVDVGIGHDDQVVFCAAQGLHALAVVRTCFVDVIGNRRRAHKADGFHIGVFQQRVHGFFVALHDVEHAVGQTGFFEQFGHEQRGCRIGRAGFEDEGVARRNGDREHPHGHHHGKVERRDACDHAQRLAHRPVVDAGGDLVGEIALEQLWDAGGKFHDVDAARDFALRVGEHFAVFGGNHVGQLVLVLVEQLQELEHHAGAAQRRGVGPCGEGGLCSGHGLGHFGAVGQRNAARHCTCSGVGHGLAAARSACGDLAADVMTDVRDAHV